MNTLRILSLLNQIEMIVATVCDTGYTLQPGDEEAIFSRVREIMNEVNAPPKSNGDFIRHMTDEELAEFIVSHSKYVYDVCQFYNVTKVSRIIEWLKQGVNTNDDNG